MTHGTDHVFDYEPEQEPEPEPGLELLERRRSRTIVVVSALVLIGVASALVWLAYGDNLQPGSTALPDKPVTLNDFQAFQQQITAQMQTAMQLLESQRAEIKRLSDQTAALAAKIDAFGQSALAARAAIPPAAPAAPKSTKKTAPKPTPGISTGGAPLPLEANPESR